MSITIDDLKKSGFTPFGKPGVFSKRIHDLIFIEFDTNDCFVTLSRKNEFSKKHKGRDCEFYKITLPGKKDTIEKLITLLDILE